MARDNPFGVPPGLALIEDKAIRPAPHNVVPFTLQRVFTFTALPSSQDSIAVLSQSFLLGNDYILEGVNVMSDSSPAAPADAVDFLYVALFLGEQRRPLQSNPINASLLRGGAHTAAARRSWGLPKGFKPSYIPGDTPIIVQVDNRRALASAGDVMNVNLAVFGVRKYPE